MDNVWNDEKCHRGNHDNYKLANHFSIGKTCQHNKAQAQQHTYVVNQSFMIISIIQYPENARKHNEENQLSSINQYDFILLCLHKNNDIATKMHAINHPSLQYCRLSFRSTMSIHQQDKA